MKRTTSILALGLIIVALGASSLAAQPMMGRGYGYAPGAGLASAAQAAPEAASIEGKLVFVDKYPAVQTKDKTYMIHMPRFFFTAYSEGIKEGATVKADGYILPVIPGQDKPNFQVTKAVINGKTYDYTTPAAAGAFGGRGGMMGGAYGGRGMMGGDYGNGGRGGMMGGRGGRW